MSMTLCDMLAMSMTLCGVCGIAMHTLLPQELGLLIPVILTVQVLLFDLHILSRIRLWMGNARSAHNFHASPHESKFLWVATLLSRVLPHWVCTGVMLMMRYRLAHGSLVPECLTLYNPLCDVTRGSVTFILTVCSSVQYS